MKEQGRRLITEKEQAYLIERIELDNSIRDKRAPVMRTVLIIALVVLNGTILALSIAAWKNPIGLVFGMPYSILMLMVMRGITNARSKLYHKVLDGTLYVKDAVCLYGAQTTYPRRQGGYFRFYENGKKKERYCQCIYWDAIKSNQKVIFVFVNGYTWVFRKPE